MWRVALKIYGEGDNVVAYRDRAYLFTDANDEEDQKLAAEAVRFFGLEKWLSQDDADANSLREAVEEYKPEALLGYIDGDKLAMSPRDYRHGRGSRLLRALLRQLDLRGVSVSSEMEEAEYIPTEEVAGGLPDALLHGTSSERMPGILRLGLTPDEAATNYERGEIYHPDTVFLTDNPQKAAYHAENTTYGYGKKRPYGMSAVAKGFPVVVEFAVPDKAKFVPDYDLDIWSEAGEGSYEMTKKHRERKKQRGLNTTTEDPFNLSRKFGVFGYRGRIPASFIRSIRIRVSEGEASSFASGDWASVTEAQLVQAMEYGEASAYEWEDTCPECGGTEDDCDCERCEKCGEKEGECSCEEATGIAASPYWRAFDIVARAT